MNNILNIIKESQSVNDAIIKIYGYNNKTSKQKFLKFVNDNSVNTDHFKKRKFIYTRVNKICPICGIEFETLLNHKHQKTTCSHACANSYFRRGKFNPNWKDEVYRTTCFSYHKKECIVCKESNIVSVHHYDENRNNNSPENLIPLCPTHHQYVHSRYKNIVIDIINEYRNEFIKSIFIDN
jgi:hypothetical protein